MSVRAYRIVEIIKEDEPTFNLWRDEKIMDLLNVQVSEGLLQVEQEQIEKAIATPDLDKETLETLGTMLKQAIEDGGTVEYLCY